VPEWLFSQEKATLQKAGKGSIIVEPL
jgi:hypothetical protein